MRSRLQSVVEVPYGEIDDTRWEKLVSWFESLFIPSSFSSNDPASSHSLASVVETLIERGFPSIVEVGMVHEDSRVLACVLRMMGRFCGSSLGFSHFCRVGRVAVRRDALERDAAYCPSPSPLLPSLDASPSLENLLIYSSSQEYRVRVAAVDALSKIANHALGLQWWVD